MREYIINSVGTNEADRRGDYILFLFEVIEAPTNIRKVFTVKVNTQESSRMEDLTPGQLAAHKLIEYFESLSTAELCDIFATQTEHPIMSDVLHSKICDEIEFPFTYIKQHQQDRIGFK